MLSAIVILAVRSVPLYHGIVVGTNATAGPGPAMGRLKTTSILAYADRARRPATVAEQVSMMVYLLSPESGNLTGATYATDGAWTAF